MSWRRRIGAAVGMSAIGLATAVVAAPTRTLGYLPPETEELLTQHPVQPAIAVLLVGYAGWMVFSRGWLSPVHEARVAPPNTEWGSARERTNGTDSDTSDGEFVPLEHISGVGPSKADALREAGYTSVDDARTASQSELSDIVGNALAARIKADVRDADVSTGAETGVEGEFDDTAVTGNDRVASGPAVESISVLGRDVVTFTSPSEQQSAGASEPAGSLGGTEPNNDTDSGGEEGTTPPAEPRVVPASPDAFETLQSNAPEQPQVGTETIVGSDFEVTLEEAIRSYGRRDDLFGIFDERRGLPEESEASGMRPEEVLRERLIALRATVAGSEGPGSRLDRDEWTTDPGVRLFFEPNRSDTLPLRYRARVWLTPETTFERLVERSIEALEDAYDRSGDE